MGFVAAGLVALLFQNEAPVDLRTLKREHVRAANHDCVGVWFIFQNIC